MEDRIKVLVVDDESLARRGIRDLLESEKDFEIVGEARNGREALSAIQRLAPDLVFLDVRMPLVDGFASLEKIAPENLPEIVFVTAHDEHAIRAFEAGALDYLLKPINEERFHNCLKRIRHRLAERRNGRIPAKLLESIRDITLRSKEPYYPQRFSVKQNERVVFVAVNDIIWIASEGNYVRLHTQDRSYLLRGTMDGIQAKLNPRDFVRLRSSTIGRISQIQELHPLFNGEFLVVLKNGKELRSSRRYRHNLDPLLNT